jgi:hypothetical protein
MSSNQVRNNYSAFKSCNKKHKKVSSNNTQCNDSDTNNLNKFSSFRKHRSIKKHHNTDNDEKKDTLSSKTEKVNVAIVYRHKGMYRTTSMFEELGIPYKIVEEKDIPYDDPYWYVNEGCDYCGRRGACPC